MVIHAFKGSRKRHEAKKAAEAAEAAAAAAEEREEQDQVAAETEVKKEAPKKMSIAERARMGSSAADEEDSE